MNAQTISECESKVLREEKLSFEEAKNLMNVSDSEVKILAKSANNITRKFNGLKVDVEELNNIKKNGCSEDCVFCAQSAFYDTQIERYQLPPPPEIVKQAQKAKDDGAVSYCLVAAWREPSTEEFKQVCDIIEEINEKVGIKVDCSLGFLTAQQAKKLKELNVHRYNHNLETSRSKFPEICSTHTFQDRIDTLKIARDAGIQLCTGGILGMGETRKQRLELIQDIASLSPEEVTLNILVPMPGTPLELQTPLSKLEIIRTFAVLRFLLPYSIIKISGGRELTQDDQGEELLQSGANGIITSGYLTMGGNNPEKDIQMIEKIGLEA
ncbi:MAG: biotin synthase BioB [Nitrosopumilaceae archaeon]